PNPEPDHLGGRADALAHACQPQTRLERLDIPQDCHQPTLAKPGDYDIRHAVLNGAPADLLPKRPGPHTPSKRTKEVEALIIRTRFETDLNRDAIAEALTQQGCKVSARLVGQVLADYGLAKKNR